LEKIGGSQVNPKEEDLEKEKIREREKEKKKKKKKERRSDDRGMVPGRGTSSSSRNSHGGEAAYSHDGDRENSQGS
jgi:hypothetical protein